MAKSLDPNSISDDSLGNFIVGGKLVGYTIDIEVTRYRSLPLSCIEEFGLQVDGQQVDPLDVTFCINGKRFMISQLKDLYAETWDLNQKARLEVLKSGGLKAGEHKIDLKLHMRIPYIYANDTFDIKRSDLEEFSFAVENSSCSATVTLMD